MNWRDLMRAWQWLVAAAVATLMVLVFYPQLAGYLVWGLTKLTWAIWLGYFADRILYPYARPHEAPDNPMLQIRRAIVVAACVIGLALLT